MGFRRKCVSPVEFSARRGSVAGPISTCESVFLSVVLGYGASSE